MIVCSPSSIHLQSIVNIIPTISTNDHPSMGMMINNTSNALAPAAYEPHQPDAAPVPQIFENMLEFSSQPFTQPTPTTGCYFDPCWWHDIDLSESSTPNNVMNNAMSPILTERFSEVIDDGFLESLFGSPSVQQQKHHSYEQGLKPTTPANRTTSVTTESNTMSWLYY